ncbi:hypothetical protein BD324DRAFT_652901 [Kockovaella imperatae]|uniref:Uncharacterized protein n=1 Tax=Kockovaella imperatae TaxID=4999 RepID=A0A1Y1U9E5_9TREE|nr:hypothetical protein BD324DRAFT_652901 [Kockovaella imperatae]ORX34632.1 hypothetical protein BD324DRAFT_652901 [Kockovaella imperatae]
MTIKADSSQPLDLDVSDEACLTHQSLPPGRRTILPQPETPRYLPTWATRRQNASLLIPAKARNPSLLAFADTAVQRKTRQRSGAKILEMRPSIFGGGTKTVQPMRIAAKDAGTLPDLDAIRARETKRQQREQQKQGSRITIRTASLSKHYFRSGQKSKPSAKIRLKCKSVDDGGKALKKNDAVRSPAWDEDEMEVASIIVDLSRPKPSKPKWNLLDTRPSFLYNRPPPKPMSIIEVPSHFFSRPRARSNSSVSNPPSQAFNCKAKKPSRLSSGSSTSSTTPSRRRPQHKLDPIKTSRSTQDKVDVDARLTTASTVLQTPQLSFEPLAVVQIAGQGNLMVDYPLVTDQDAVNPTSEAVFFTSPKDMDDEMGEPRPLHHTACLICRPFD